jgi:DNA polymerase-3 subunit delta
MLYLLHGADELTRSEEIAKLKQKLGDPTVVSLNTTVLDGRKVNLPTLIQVCDALPFMAKRRLVIVEDFWSRFEAPEGGKAKDKPPKTPASDTALIKALLEYLPRLPETTDLVFVESRSLQKTNPAFNAVPSGQKGIACVEEFNPPQEKRGELGRWIERRMKAKGGEIMPQAAQELAHFIGGDLRQLDQELDKLWAYASFERPVSIADVHNLVSATQTDSVFALVDAIGLRQREKAMRVLHELLEAGAAPLYLLSMIERQFRILLQVKDLQARGFASSEMQKTLGIKHPFIIEKSVGQAQYFSMRTLEAIYRRLADLEQEIKTGEIEDLLALDLLVVGLCG